MTGELTSTTIFFNELEIFDWYTWEGVRHMGRGLGRGQTCNFCPTIRITKLANEETGRKRGQACDIAIYGWGL